MKERRRETKVEPSTEIVGLRDEPGKGKKTERRSKLGKLERSLMDKYKDIMSVFGVRVFTVCIILYLERT